MNVEGVNPVNVEGVNPVNVEGVNPVNVEGVNSVNDVVEVVTTKIAPFDIKFRKTIFVFLNCI